MFYYYLHYSQESFDLSWLHITICLLIFILAARL